MPPQFGLTRFYDVIMRNSFFWLGNSRSPAEAVENDQEHITSCSNKVGRYLV